MGHKTFTNSLFTFLLLIPMLGNAQYCMLPGRKIYSTAQPGITNFKLGTINRSSSNVEGPLNMPSVVVTTDTTKLERGKTYTVTIAHSKDAASFPTARNNVRVWIDYNKNYKFTDAQETVISKDLEAPGTVYTATFTVPQDAPLGTTRLRALAKMSPDAGHVAPTSCDEPKDPLDFHGEIEDYHVTIVAATSVQSLASGGSGCLVYPNPAYDHAIVSFASIEQLPLKVALYDISGRMVAEAVNEQKQSALEYYIDLDKHLLHSGIFFLKVTRGTDLSISKIVKQ